MLMTTFTRGNGASKQKSKTRRTAKGGRGHTTPPQDISKFFIRFGVRATQKVDNTNKSSTFDAR